MIAKYIFNPPFTRQAGDTFVRAGNVFQQWRNGQLIDARDLINGQPLVEFELVGGNSVEALYLEETMPGQNVTCTKVVENQTTGSVTVSFSSGNNIEFSSWADVGLIADQLDASPDFAEKVLLMKAFRASPDGANKSTQIGASVSINGLADVPVVYTETV